MIIKETLFLLLLSIFIQARTFMETSKLMLPGGCDISCNSFYLLIISWTVNFVRIVFLFNVQQIPYDCTSNIFWNHANSRVFNDVHSYVSYRFNSLRYGGNRQQGENHCSLFSRAGDTKI